MAVTPRAVQLEEGVAAPEDQVGPAREVVFRFRLPILLAEAVAEEAAVAVALRTEPLVLVLLVETEAMDILEQVAPRLILEMELLMPAEVPAVIRVEREATGLQVFIGKIAQTT